ncbi:MAG: hypothetical protein HXS54_08605 [Theionarchaea archaeon]|nr:hypothetical protein [Theionarchaea archaeon]
MKLKMYVLIFFLLFLPYLIWHLVFAENPGIIFNWPQADTLLVLGAILQGSIAALSIIFVGLTIAFSRVKEESKILMIKDVLFFDTSGHKIFGRLKGHLKNFLIRLLQYDLTLSIMYLAIFILVSVLLILYIIRGVGYLQIDSIIEKVPNEELTNTNYSHLVSHTLNLASLSIIYLVFGLFSFFVTYFDFVTMTKRRRVIEQTENMLHEYCRDLLSREYLVSITKMIDERLEDRGFEKIAKICILIEILRHNKKDLFKKVSESMNLDEETLRIIEFNVYKDILPEKLRKRYLDKANLNFNIDLPKIVFPENLLKDRDENIRLDTLKVIGDIGHLFPSQAISILKDSAKSSRREFRDATIANIQKLYPTMTRESLFLLTDLIREEDEDISERCINLFEQISKEYQELAIFILLERIGNEGLDIDSRTIRISKCLFKMNSQTFVQTLYDSVEKESCIKNGVAKILKEIYIFKMSSGTRNQLIDLVETLARVGDVRTREFLTESVGEICLILNKSESSREFGRLYYILTELGKDEVLKTISQSYIKRI